ncbi:MAG: IS200/IS605 family transposase [Kiritimatiellaeota bacterium]|nr:IS200/IS605 family transposase [Kiritimatiellota bacterium]
MPQSLTNVYVHIVFSTKNRCPLIDDSVRQTLWAYIGGICRTLECFAFRVGGTSDHIHICCLLSKKVTQVELLQEVKRKSSLWMKTQGARYADFYWQDGYGVFSVSPPETGKVAEYIDNQHEHHKTRTFQEEFLAFLKKYGVEYDERYLWD